MTISRRALRRYQIAAGRRGRLFRKMLLSSTVITGLVPASVVSPMPVSPMVTFAARSSILRMGEGGKGFGGGEATRDPAPTQYDPNDPKGKQQAIHKAESFAEYLAKRNAGGGEATRDPEPTDINPNDPKGKQQAIHKAESFADYLASRSGGATATKGRRVHPLN